MPEQQSLDELIAAKAIEFSEQVRATAGVAAKEEEIRIEVERQLAFIEREAGVKFEGKHEFTLASGRVDSVYDRVIIEYKNPNTSDRIGPSLKSPGSKRVVEQIKRRFYDMRAGHGHELKNLFGVGLDGKRILFVRFRDDKWQEQEPVEFNRHSAERFLWALFNLGEKGRPFSPEYLSGDFGSEAKLALEGVRTLYEAITTTDHPKAETFFGQWKILFGEVCGYDVENPSEKIKKLAKSYEIPLTGLKPAALLFALQTYYALFMKLLASQIVAFFHRLPTPLEKMIKAGTSQKLLEEMRELEAGGIFRHFNITNFLEGDLFAWYLDVWDEPVENVVRRMVGRLDGYHPGTLSEDPAVSRDLLKKLYHQLFPKSVRHDLGEYYTPDWLAEHVLNELGYEGDPDKRLLDPACGSGTFLVMAINRIRAWYEKNREQCRYAEDDLCRKILANVIGFDLNPLAVLAARTNYLIAVRDLVHHVDRVEIPIYLCDSILTPSSYGDLFTGKAGAVKEFKTAAARFLVPTEIAETPDDVARYAEQLEFCVRNEYTPDEFLQRCRDEGLSVAAESLHADLYNELVALDKAGKNGVWARIIKNAFAPLFVGRVDYVAGNPPWVNWNNLPAEYRTDVIQLNDAVYDLFPHTGVRARHGSASIDLSTLFVYVAADRYLSDDGMLGFVITQSVFKSSGGSEGFRRFSLPDGTKLGVKSVDDFSGFQPFEGASNRTATLVIQRGKRTRFPAPYRKWTPSGERIDSNSIVRPPMKSERLCAWPVDEKNLQSPWCTVPARFATGLRKVLGSSELEAKLGTHTWLNGAYWLSKDEPVNRNRRLIKNAGDVGRKHVRSIETVVEGDLVYPLVRGRDVSRWRCAPSLSMILPHDPTRPSVGISIPKMKRDYPKAFEYFNQLRKDLEGRSGFKKYIEPADGPFYAVYNIGTYTFQPYRVAWKEQSQSLQACVISTANDGRLIIPDHKLTIIGFSAKHDAFFICGLLNSIPVRAVVAAYAIDVQISTHVCSFVRIPKFNSRDANHKRIASLSEKCHSAAAKGDSIALESLERELNDCCSTVWGLRSEELEYLKEAVST